MRSIVFNNPHVVFWICIGASILVGAILALACCFILKERIIRKAVDKKYPEMKRGYDEALQEALSTIARIETENAAYRRRQALIVLFAGKIVEAIGGA